MSFSTSENRARGGPGGIRHARRVAATVAAAAILTGVCGLAWRSAAAGEATARGKKADITWIDDKGTQHQEAARDIEFGYFTRVYLTVAKDGRKFKDEARERKGIQLGGDYTSFSVLDKIEFAWTKDDATGVARLKVKLTQANGKVFEGGGNTLAGASHPMSPYFVFKVAGEARRIELLPMAAEPDRAGKPQLVTIQFTL